MKRWRTWFGRLAFLLLMVLLFITPASAAEQSFEDVSSDSPWAGGIRYVRDKGISVGTGNGRFAPDAPITVRQWAVMLCRALGEGDTANIWETGSETGYRNGWLDMTSLLAPEMSMTRTSVYQSAFTAFGVPTYSTELYSGDNSKVENRYVRAAKELDLCGDTAEPGLTMTRGEAAQVIYLLQTRKYDTVLPPILDEFPVENRSGVDLNPYLLELQAVPESIREQFVDFGWKFIIDLKTVNRYAVQLQTNCIGICSGRDRIIYVSNRAAVVHEMGHFLHQMIGFPAQFDAIFDAEAESARPVLRDYSLTSSAEYFADCFRLWIERPSERGDLRERAPRTYAFFSELDQNEWSIKFNLQEE